MLCLVRQNCVYTTYLWDYSNFNIIFCVMRLIFIYIQQELLQWQAMHELNCKAFKLQRHSIIYHLYWYAIHTGMTRSLMVHRVYAKNLQDFYVAYCTCNHKRRRYNDAVLWIFIWGVTELYKTLCRKSELPSRRGLNIMYIHIILFK